MRLTIVRLKYAKIRSNEAKTNPNEAEVCKNLRSNDAEICKN